jgi:hypothetical protein
MGPATARAYQLIVDQVLTHDGDPHLAWHSVAACKRAGGSRRGGQAGNRPHFMDRDGNRQGDAAVAKEHAKTGSLSFRDFASAEVSGTRCPAARQRSIASDLADDLTVLWAGAGQRRARLADPGSSLCWQPSAAVPTVGRCVEEPQHQRGDKLRIIGDRDVAQTGQPSQLRMLDEGEESRALHADQRVGGPLQKQGPGR